MSKSQVTILNFKILYNILFELNDVIKFEVLFSDNEEDFIKKNKESSSIIVTNKKVSNKNINPKNIIVLNDLPIKFIDVIDKINTKILVAKKNFFISYFQNSLFR